MKEWLPTIASFCTVVLATVAIITFVQAGHGQLPADMRDAHGSIRADMRAGNDSIRADIREMRTEMREEHAEMRGEHAEMRDRLNSIDRRTARIEGHLFGIEVAPEPTDGE